MAYAPAEIAGQSFFDFFFRGMRVFIQQCLGSHDHSGCTVAALKRGVLNESLLKFIECTGLLIRQTFDCSYCLSIAFDCQDLTGKDSPPIHDYCAAAACAFIAGNLGPCKTERFSKGPR